MIMPGMSGLELKNRVLETHAQIKQLFMSGYTDDSLTSGGMLDLETAFIEKPFTPDALSRKVREVLDG
jgi:FixJ family two-component response regulator